MNILFNQRYFADEEQTSDRNCFSLLRNYIPCKSKWVFILIVGVCVVSALSGLAVAAYFLYLHCKLYNNHTTIRQSDYIDIIIQLLSTRWLELYLCVKQLIQQFVMLEVVLQVVAISYLRMDVHILVATLLPVYAKYFPKRIAKVIYRK